MQWRTACVVMWQLLLGRPDLKTAPQEVKEKSFGFVENQSKYAKLEEKLN